MKASVIVPLVEIVVGLCTIIFRRRIAENRDNQNRRLLDRWSWAKWLTGPTGPKDMRNFRIMCVIVGSGFIAMGVLGLLGIVKFK